MEIKSLTLQTDNLQSMKEFYMNKLGFHLIAENKGSFQIQTGTSILEFTNSDTVGKPFYHFAFNIPANQFEEAKFWLKNKVQLLTEDGEDQVNFSHLPAHAIYFEDPSGNIVEFIARYGINEESSEPFTINSILHISEIGLIVDDVLKVGKELSKAHIFERDNKPLNEKSLNFMGVREIGIFIILARPRRRWIFSDKYSTIYPLEISVKNGRKLIVNHDGEFIIE
ncbi:VOC family protein [Lysinibacillus xylanilyticus]|uniref:VOC family protein n=1 Tax=Lysinibacillus xylanilyticus TaxID=582475 RepID=UPI002E1A69F7|nr:VOC family protein [Lysinibacillus xylanilyticus]